METLVQDLKFGIKLLWKNKGFAATALVTLSLCIGANTAIFSVINSVVFSPLPIPESDRILMMYNSYPNAGAEFSANGVPDYYDRLRELDDVFEEQAFYNFPSLTLGGQGSPERVPGMAVTPSFFRLLKVEAQLGRTFVEEEGEIGNERKVILSHPTWQQLYGGDDAILGKDLHINDEPYVIVGVLADDFIYRRPDTRVWIPLAFTAEQKSDNARHSNNWQNIGRLKPGATLEQAQAQLDALTASNHERFPAFKEILINAGFHVQVHRLKDVIVRDVRETLYLLWVGVLFVLLIGSVNITNLMFVRSSVRLKELATRTALGAARGRVAQQLLTETVLLTLLGGGFGLVLGQAGLSLMRTLGINEIPRGSERILFVDDEPSIADVGKQMLERLGYRVTALTSSPAALERFRAAPEAFDLVITDQTLPEMTGDELTRELLAIRSDLPVIICTGYSEVIDDKKARALGARRLLMKPLALRPLAAAVREVLDGT